ncbi:MAG: hypothetical protein OEU92_07300 [Alphaproteobacteria bacterium]|nr:hypothetical protein [Alphaproteobacteria bacterium]
MTKTLWPTKGWLGKIWPWSGRHMHDTNLDVDAPANDITDPSDEAPQQIDEEKGESSPRCQSANQGWALEQLEVGQSILVQAGRNGSQKAEIVEAPQITGEDAFITVRKYRARSNSWTKPVRCYPHQIIGLADAAERTSA